MIPGVPVRGLFLLALVVRLGAVAASYVAPADVALRAFRPSAHPCAGLADYLERRPMCAALAEDEIAYDQLGRSIAAGHGYVLDQPWVYGTGYAPTAYGNFLYPAFVGAVYALSGGSALALVLLQSLLGALAVAALASLAFRLSGRRAGVAVGLIAALHPGLALSSALVMTEALAIPILVAVFVAWSGFLRAPNYGRAALVGALAAAACLTRSPSMYAIPVMVVATLVGRDAYAARRPGPLLAGLAVAAVLLVPWAARNARVFGGFVPSDTKAGAALWLYNHPSDAPLREAWSGVWAADPPLTPIPGLNEAQVERHFRDLALRHIAHQPGTFVAVSLVRLGLFLAPFPRNWHLPWLKAATSVLYLATTWLGIAGLWRERRMPEVRAVLGLFFAMLALLAATTTGLRHRLSLEWILAFGAGLAVAHLRPAPSPGVPREPATPQTGPA